MDSLTALSAQFDPLRPVEADETDLWVDWQDQLDTAVRRALGPYSMTSSLRI